MSFWKNNQSDINRLILAILVNIATLLGKSFYDGKGFEYLILVSAISGIILIFYALNLFVLYKMQTKFSIEKIAKVIDEYRATHELKGSEWYYNMEELEEFEFEDYIQDKTNNNKEVWVVTRYLEHDHPESHLHAKIKINVIKHKVKYKYIIPNSDDKGLQEKSEKLYDEFEKDYKQGNPFTIISDEAFDYPCDILIFKHSDKNSITVFMELRVTKNPEDRKWAKIENSSARRIYENINADISNNQICIAIENTKFKRFLN